LTVWRLLLIDKM